MSAVPISWDWEDGQEPPAVVSLVIGNGRARRARPAALAATVLDLADRRCLDLAWTAGDPPALVCRSERKPALARLRPFEERVLDRAVARLGGGEAPVAALLPDPGDGDAGRWYAAFDQDVIEAATRAGLVRPRLATGPRRLLTAVAVLPALVPLWLLLRSGNRDPEAIGIIAFAGLAIFRLLTVLLPRGVRPTAAGRRAAARWRATPAPGTAHAVAAGRNPDLLAAFAPPPKKFVWSGYGGRWRPLRVDLADEIVPRDGPMSPRFVALAGGAILVLVTIPTLWLVPELWSSPFGWPLVLLPPAILAAAVGYAVRAADRHRQALAAARMFEGQVVRRWMEEDSDSAAWYLAVDDGASAMTRTWSVGHALYERFPTGSRVRVTVDGRGRLLSMDARQPLGTNTGSTK